MLQALTGKTFIVTGGGTGIGFACAERLVLDGAHVVICGRTHETLARAAKSIGAAASAGAIDYVVADVTIEEDVERLFEKAMEGSGTLDGLVANAGGGGTPGAVHQQDLAEFSRIVQINLMASMLCIKHAIRPMRQAGGGSIILMSSLNGDPRVACNFTSAYSAAKAGMDQMMRVAAWEYGPDKIRVNSIRPGFIHTEINDTYVGVGTDFYQSCRDNVPLHGDLGQPEDIAWTARFLLGPESRWITGQTINVDGGQSLGRGPDSSALVQGMDGTR